ncbi:MAG: hypothetical protein NDJ89_07590 [Oligoflexia bacterium]|nr:hypothetical protein [Oligoflexia bacterium]
MLISFVPAAAWAESKESSKDPSMISGAQALELLQEDDDFGELSRERLRTYEKLGQSRRAVPFSSLKWPFPDRIRTIRVSARDLGKLESALGVSFSRLPLMVSEFGGASIDPQQLLKVLDHVDIRRTGAQTFEVDFTLKPQHCKLSRMDDASCEKDRIYFPLSKQPVFEQLARAHELLRNPGAQAGAPCESSGNAAEELLPGLRPGLRELGPGPQSRSEKVRELAERFKSSPYWDFQSIELEPRVKLNIAIEPDADGDAVLKVHGFKGIQAHLTIPEVSASVVPEARFLSGILDSFTKNAMNGTFDFFPDELVTSKADRKAVVSGGLGAVSISFSERDGVGAMGLDRNSAVVKFLSERFAMRRF